MPRKNKFVDRENTKKLIEESVKVRMPNYFFKNYLDENGKLKLDKPNREGMSTDRTAMNSLAICYMMRKGYSLKDILNPEILEEERQAVGKEIYETYHLLTEKEFPLVMAEYMAATLKSVLFEINKEIADLPEITGRELAKPEHSHIFKALSLIQDLGQEIGRPNIKAAAHEIYGKDFIDKLTTIQSGGNYMLDVLFKSQTEKYKMTQGAVGTFTSEDVQNDRHVQQGLFNYIFPSIQAGYAEEALKEQKMKKGTVNIYGDFTFGSPLVDKLVGISNSVAGASDIQNDIENYLALDYVGNLKKLGEAIEDGIFEGQNVRFDKKGNTKINGFKDNLERLEYGETIYSGNEEENEVDALIKELSLKSAPEGYTIFKTKEYSLTKHSMNLPKDIQACGNIRDLAEFYLNNKNILSEDEKAFLTDRIVNNIKLNNFAKRIKNGDIDIKTKMVKGGNTYSFPTIKLDGIQTSNNGCWSCSISLLLQSRGIELDQREIREYRCGISRADYLKAGSKEHLLRDEPTGIEENADVLINLLPNTGVYTREVMSGTNDERRNIIAKTLKEAFEENSSPLSINLGGHYITITGVDTTGEEKEWKLTYQDSADEPALYTCNIDELMGYFTEPSFSMSYLVDINNQNELSKIKNDNLVKRIKYDDDNNIVPLEGDQKPDAQNGPCTSGLNFNTTSGDLNDGMLIREAIYMPKSIDPTLPTKYEEKVADKRTIERNSQYLKEFIRFANDIKKTDSAFSRDTDSYKAFHSVLEKSLIDLKAVDQARFGDRFQECIRKVSFAADQYKKAHMNLDKLSERQIKRIKTMNRLENLQRRWNRGEVNLTENLDYMIGEKFTEGYMINQVNGKEAKKYIKLFCNSKVVDESAIKLAQNHPFEMKHGEQLSDEIKQKFLYKPCVQVFDNAMGLLNMNQKQYNALLEEVDGIINYAAKEAAPSKKMQVYNGPDTKTI